MHLAYKLLIVLAFVLVLAHSWTSPKLRTAVVVRSLSMKNDFDKDDEEVRRFRTEALNLRDDITPRRPRGASITPFLGIAFIGLAILQNGGISNPLAAVGMYPLAGEESLMRPKAHGTTETAVQNNLRFGCSVELADRICSFNRRWAENAGYWTSTKFISELDRTGVNTFYDSVTGKPLFRAPVGRTLDEFLAESRVHGWPSFRDEEVVWANVRCLRDGESVSVDGTHLGHNLPDARGNRYCINLVSIAGNPVNGKEGQDFFDSSI